MYMASFVKHNKVVHVAFLTRRYKDNDIIKVGGFNHTVGYMKDKGYNIEYKGYRLI